MHAMCLELVKCQDLTGQFSAKAKVGLHALLFQL